MTGNNFFGRQNNRIASMWHPDDEFTNRSRASSLVCLAVFLSVTGILVMAGINGVSAALTGAATGLMCSVLIFRHVTRPVAYAIMIAVIGALIIAALVYRQ
jgi:hypothetical protein